MAIVPASVPPKISIPKRLNHLLGSSELQGPVRSALREFEVWVGSSKPEFFPEFTDHGPDHISSVLATAEALVARRAWSVVSSSDAAILILAVLLHDSAMHLTSDGFVDLVQHGLGKAPISGFDDKPWGLLWQDFLSEASRFSGKQLNALFGKPEPIPAPALDPPSWTEDQKRLIGEFVRRHHPRLAHEIAVNGVPGPEGPRLRMAIAREISDLAGLIARSHGLSIRQCIPYLSSNFDLRVYKGVHAVYLMAVLRISDYLQIQAARAPKQLQSVYRIRSPRSQLEWDVHNSVQNITTGTDDPEGISVQAKPDNIRSFARLREWLDGIQMELDKSWAVLGEVYGRFEQERWNRLGLTIRRVTSNLDTPDFAERSGYVPRKTSFGTTDAELLNLLIRPLYGDEPEIGIREMLQNALDAVRELRELQKQHPALKSDRAIDQEADVVVTLEEEPDGKKWVTVSDKGIGMTEEVIRTYFLTAGASFRASDYWKAKFEKKRGQPRVLRSGRFGIGVLAAFLLGDRIHVVTRHAEEPAARGIAFTASLSDDLIELRRVTRPVGTVVRVELTRETYSRLVENPSSWDWYVGRSLKVRRRLRPSNKKLTQTRLVPSGRRALRGWRRIRHPDYAAIYWKEAPSYYNILACNEILVDSGHNWMRLPYDARGAFHGEVFMSPFGWKLRMPSIAITDPKAALPLNLQRTTLLGARLPFHNQLLDSMLSEVIRWAITNRPNGPPWMRNGGGGSRFQAIPYIATDRDGGFLPWAWCRDGFTLLDRSLLQILGVRSVVIASFFQREYTEPERVSLPKIVLGKVEAGLCYRMVPLAFVPIDEAHKRYGKLSAAKGPRDLVRIAVWGEDCEGLIDALTDWDLEHVDVGTSAANDWQDRPVSVHQTAECPGDASRIRRVARSGMMSGDSGILAEIYFRHHPPEEPLSPLASLWLKLVGKKLLAYGSKR